MTELADRFIVGLCSRGYTFHFDEEDLVIQSKRMPGTRFAIMRTLLEEEALEMLLIAAIVSFTQQEGPRHYRLGMALGEEPDHGMN